MPARAYSLPLADEKAAFSDYVEPATPYIKSLNGIWKMHWCGDPARRPKDFFKPGFDDSEWNTIDVPSCVETRGFGVPGYTNINYPHKMDQPRIRDVVTGAADYNPVSSYRTVFTVPESWNGRDIILRFDGVYSAYHVWVNGKQVGYSEDSKLPGEFDITSFVKRGDNLLAVEVFRWCDGSYLEDQDMFRFSGIFRDVSIIGMPRKRIQDFYVHTTLSDNYRDATVELEVSTTANKVTSTLYDAAGKSVGKILSGCYTKTAAVENGSKFCIDRDTGIISVRAGYPCCFSAKTAFYLFFHLIGDSILSADKISILEAFFVLFEIICGIFIKLAL
jgi:beta-galactosidase